MNDREKQQLLQRLAELERLVTQLVQPKNVARLIPAQPIRMFRFELNADFDTGTASATFFEMDGGAEVETQDLKDPELIAIALNSGARGYCFRQDGKYWWIQAGCPIA